MESRIETTNLMVGAIWEGFPLTLTKKKEKPRLKGPPVIAGSFDWVAVMTATHNHRHHSWPSNRKALNIWPTLTDFHLCYEKFQIFPPTALWEKKTNRKRKTLIRQRSSDEDASVRLYLLFLIERKKQRLVYIVPPASEARGWSPALLLLLLLCLHQATPE